MYETVWLLGPDLGAQEGLWGPGHRGNLQRVLRKLSNRALWRAPETSVRGRRGVLRNFSFGGRRENPEWFCGTFDRHFIFLEFSTTIFLEPGHWPPRGIDLFKVVLGLRNARDSVLLLPRSLGLHCLPFASCTAARLPGLQQAGGGVRVLGRRGK